jgi:hypothetical protein
MKLAGRSGLCIDEILVPAIASYACARYPVLFQNSSGRTRVHAIHGHG